MVATQLDSQMLEKLQSALTLTNKPHDKLPVPLHLPAPCWSRFLAAANGCGIGGGARAARSLLGRHEPSPSRRIFLRFHDLLLERQGEVLDLIQLETGKARRHAFEEVLDTAIVSRYYAFHARRLCARGAARAPCPG